MKTLSGRIGLTVVIMLVVSFAAAGCATKKAAQVERPTILQTAANTGAAGDNQHAIELYTDFLGSNPTSPFAAEAYLGRGNAYFAQREYDLAASDYQTAQNQAKDRMIKAKAALGFANAAYAQENFQAADKLYDEIQRTYAGALPQDEILYRKGMAVARQGKWDEARSLLEQVIGSYPDGDFAKPARTKLPTVTARYFSVQIQILSDRQNADKSAAKVKSAGFPAVVEPLDIDGSTKYSVRSGRFSTWQAATEHDAKLKAAGFPTYRIP